MNLTITWEKFWSIIDRVRSKADMQDEESVKQCLYTELIELSQDELLGFDCAWQSYRNKANFPKMVAAACIINDGSSDDRFMDFRNWLIMQGRSCAPILRKRVSPLNCTESIRTC